MDEPLRGLGRKTGQNRGGRSICQAARKGHEVCNFLRCADGNVYGHVETIKKDKDRQIKIENIVADAGNADSVSGIDVVWIATNPDEGGRRVVGWYRNATVYRHRQDFAKALLTRQHKKDEIDSYGIRGARAQMQDFFLWKIVPVRPCNWEPVKAG